MLFSRTVKSVAALLLLTIGLAVPVHAQTNKQIISGTWYEDRASQPTVSSDQLILTFAQTPTNQFLNITNVSCNVTVVSTAAITSMLLVAGTTSGADDLGRFYEIKGGGIPEIVSGGKIYSIVTNQVFYKYGPGRFPSIVINTASPGSLSITASCVIVGNLTDS
jgi:hypothetical protein